MKRKEVILFMIVGTGTDSNSDDGGFKLLAQKLYSTITKIYPNKVFPVVSFCQSHKITII